MPFKKLVSDIVSGIECASAGLMTTPCAVLCSVCCAQCALLCWAVLCCAVHAAGKGQSWVTQPAEMKALEKP